MINSQMKSFVDQTGGLWMSQALNGKVASEISSASNQQGGLELVLVTTQAMLQHHGMIIVPLGYGYKDQMGDDVLRGGSPYGMTTISGPTEQRMPSKQEPDGARYQGGRVAEVAAKLIA